MSGSQSRQSKTSRTVALLGPHGAGKTLLLESIATITGAIPRKGSVTAGSSLGDTGNGFLSAIGIIEALYERDRTGKRQFVRTSILYAHLLNASTAWQTSTGEGAHSTLASVRSPSPPPMVASTVTVVSPVEAR